MKIEFSEVSLDANMDGIAINFGSEGAKASKLLILSRFNVKKWDCPF